MKIEINVCAVQALQHQDYHQLKDDLSKRRHCQRNHFQVFMISVRVFSLLKKLLRKTHSRQEQIGSHTAIIHSHSHSEEKTNCNMSCNNISEVLSDMLREKAICL